MNWFGVANDVIRPLASESEHVPVLEKARQRRFAVMPEALERRLKRDDPVLGDATKNLWRAGVLDIIFVDGEALIKMTDQGEAYYKNHPGVVR